MIENHVAGEVLSHFEKDDAKKLNVSIGKRLILLKRVELLKQEAEGKVVAEPDDDDDPVSPGFLFLLLLSHYFQYLLNLFFVVLSGRASEGIDGIP